VLELLEGVEIRQERWTMPEAVEDDDDEELWRFDDLDDEDDEDEEEFNTASPSSCSSSLSN
jgi:hypothetical protein